MERFFTLSLKEELRDVDERYLYLLAINILSNHGGEGHPR
ncbi:hypothetical protein HMPREF9999_01186 [Alloprevotella sp. oral taxon 473 str. F0040]|nr:hypothetical protein HMPREF9999_01186 [Alloprevotella sp. oral taxon 473 str. F0040]